jgi:hypothetical protein
MKGTDDPIMRADVHMMGTNVPASAFVSFFLFRYRLSSSSSLSPSVAEDASHCARALHPVAIAGPGRHPLPRAHSKKKGFSER